jgi:hypothetical protein
MVACGVLFFLSGTFTGYLIGESPKVASNTGDNTKPKRAPFTNNPILGRIVSSQQSKVMGKIRKPSHPAIDKAQSYQSTAAQ